MRSGRLGVIHHKSLRLVAAALLILSTAAPLAAEDLPSRIDPPLIDPTSAALAKAGPLGDMTIGTDKAPVTLIAYLSLTSPLSAKFFTTSYPTLKTRYIDGGKLRFILREFPLEPRATTAFALARCIGNSKIGEDKIRKDKYFAVVAALFVKQADWAGRGATSTLQDILKPFGMSDKGFNACFADAKLFDHIKAVKAEAASFGVHATPTFFLNGKRLIGDQSVDDFAKAIDPILPK